ncbi:MAG TPA: ABC transporter permease subunit, partial [Verrucomicrobiae bacterium]|nr:ABC transporter permease subunit [Verrucomicrobiae bacterium]
MTVLPVIERELRTQARLGFTYLVRVLGATALICACFWFGIVNGFTPKVGPYLFGCLNTTLVVAIWIFAPLICADCISRERREGTVGLLFLTPLKAREIVLAKGLVHGLRSMTLLLAVLPVMTISFLVGGVTWRQALLSGLVNFSCICWALAAGLLASSISKSWLRSMLLSFGLAGCFSVALMIFTGWRVIYAVRSDPAFILPFPYYGWRLQNAMNYNYLQAALPVGFFSITDLENFWGIMFGSLTHSTQRAWLREECEVAIISVMVLVVAVLIAAWNLRRRWQEEPPSARRLWMQEKFCTPVVGVGFFHRWLRRKLERNPIGWLEQRKWTGRLVTWGWLAVMISFYSAVLSAPNAWGLLGMVQGLLAWMLVGIMASSASGSFQRERESRVLELLLVSPMSAGQIISGRLRGLWGQFVPTFALLLFVWWILQEGAWPRRDFNFSMIPYFCGAFLTLPVIGLYYSLLRKHFISSFLWTLWMGVLLPFVLKWVLLQSAGFVQALIANFFPS